MGAANAMLWSMLLLLGVNYLFGVVFLQAAFHHLQSSTASADDEEKLRRYWGSLPSSMISLFMASTGGEDWFYISEPLAKVGMAVYLLFIFYMAMFLFAVTNAITSLFVEATMTRAAQDNIM